MRLSKPLAALVLAGCTLGPALAEPTAAPTLGLPNAGRGPAAPPVQIESCSLQLQGSELAAKTGQVEVQFTNEGAVEADLIRFRFDWGSDSTAYVRDVGKFSPGITITHRFRQSAGEFVSPVLAKPKIACSIEAIHFSDGTVWNNPIAGPQRTNGTAALGS